MRYSIMYLLFLPMMFSCSGQEELTDSSGGPEENLPAGVARVAFQSGPQPQCLYIFRKEGDSFRYDSTINSGWSADGKLTTRLRLGDYKFLFTGEQNAQVDVLPSPLTSDIAPEQLRFVARTDNKHPGYLLPTGELFLPEPSVAAKVYTIQGNDEIACTLKRKVSQLEFVLKRGYKEGDGYIPLPYDKEHNVLEMVSELQVEISGVARECNFNGTSGKGNMLATYLASERQSIDEQGFATFAGPFVFPPASAADEVEMKITLVPTSGAPYQPLTLKGNLEANRKLEVNLWLNSSYFDIGVTIHNGPITDRTDGDAGIWE